MLGVLVRINASLPKFHFKGPRRGPSCQPPTSTPPQCHPRPGAAPAGLECRALESTALPLRLDPVPERAHVRLLLIDGHHVHVAPTLVLDDARVHRGLAHTRGLKAQEGLRSRAATAGWSASCFVARSAGWWPRQPQGHDRRHLDSSVVSPARPDFIHSFIHFSTNIF